MLGRWEQAGSAGGAGSAGSAWSVGSAGSDMGALGELGELLGELNPHHNQNPIHDQVTGDARWNGPGDVRWNGGGGQASIMMVMAKAASPAGWRGRAGQHNDGDSKSGWLAGEGRPA